MIDIGDKTVTRRMAQASGRLLISETQAGLLESEHLTKGDWHTVAQIAGIAGAKRCSDIVPLCHPVGLDHVEVELNLVREHPAVRAVCRVTATARTGVEMEAMTGVAAALLCVYDMIKGTDKGAVIDGIQLDSKEGGRSGRWSRSSDSMGHAANPVRTRKRAKK